MKTIKHIILFIFILSMISSGFNVSFGQDRTLFYETFNSGELVSLLEKDDPFFSMVMRQDIDPKGSKLGYCKEADRKDLMVRLKTLTNKGIFSDETLFAWGRSGTEGKTALYALRKEGRCKSPGIKDIQSVSMKKSERPESWDLFISFNDSGADKWARMTRENIGRDIAIVVDGKVISAPKVQDEIKFGKCRISGDLNKDEASAIKKQLEN